MSVAHLSFHDLPPALASSLQDVVRLPLLAGMDCLRNAVSTCRATLPLCASFFAAAFVGLCVLVGVPSYTSLPDAESR